MSIAPTLPPQRLHSSSLWIGLVRSAPSTAFSVGAVLAVASDAAVVTILAAILIATLANLLVAWLAWRNFTYAVTDHELVIERGVFERRRRSIPLERIQDVAIDQGALARFLSVARVRIETGGSEADEGLLDSVALNEAHRLRATLRGMPAAEGIAAEPAGTNAEESLLYRIGPARLLLFGMFNFSLLWVAALFGALQFANDVFGFNWDDVVRWLEIGERELRARATPGGWIVLAVSALALGLLTGLVRTVARDFGFRLKFEPGRLQRTSGLVQRNETIVAVRRIQLALVQRGWIRGRVGWASLSVQTLGGSNDASGRQRLAPFATSDEVARIVAACGLPQFDRPALKPVGLGHVPRALLRHALLPGVALGGATALFPPAWPLLLILPCFVAVALLQRRYHRYALREDSLQVARGVLSQQDWIVPYDRVQTVTLRQGWLQRLLGTASVLIDTAGAGPLMRPQVIDAEVKDAAALARGLLERI